jgi:hypothetical protein
VTDIPTLPPTEVPTEVPTEIPTEAPTAPPTEAPAQASAEVSPDQNPNLYPVAGHEGAYMNLVVSAQASTYLGSGTDYAGDKATDGIEETSWQFSTKNANLGEVTLVLQLAPGSTVDEVWFKNGFWKITEGLDQYTRNGRPKEIGVSFCYDGTIRFADEMTFTLRDDTVRQDWQMIPLGRHENVTAVCIRVISIYKGSKFKTDVALSEVMTVQREGEAPQPQYQPLKHGDKNEDVRQMKLRLQELGYFKQGSDVSNSFNETCQERVRQFQKNNGLPVTGEADQATLAVLYSPMAVGN